MSVDSERAFLDILDCPIYENKIVELRELPQGDKPYSRNCI